MNKSLIVTDKVLFPLNHMNEWKQRYPVLFDNIIRANQKSQKLWNRCNLPFDIVCNEYTDLYGNTFSPFNPDPDDSFITRELKESILFRITNLYSAINWMYEKQIFTVNDFLFNQLIHTSSIDSVRCSCFSDAPYNCTYFDLPDNADLYSDDEQIIGFHAFYSYCVDDTTDHLHKYLLIILHTVSETTVTVVIPLSDRETVAESIVNTAKNADELKETINYYHNTLEPILKIILYCCSTRPDIEAVTTTVKKAYKKKGGKKAKSVNAINSGNANINAVGYRFASDLSKKKSTTGSSSTESTGAAKKPHIRKGHFHTHWTGSRKDNSRRKVVLWQAPVFVNMNTNDKNYPASIRKVK